MRTTRKWTAALVIIVLVVGIVVATTYLMRRPAPSISLAPSTLVAVQGASITFNVYGLESNGIATIYFGDGEEANTTSTLTHVYQNAGRYLVGAQEFVGGQPVASTFNALQTIQVTPQVSASVAPLISIPTIAFNVSRNPGAPVFQVGDQVYLYAGFLEPPSGIKITTLPTKGMTGCIGGGPANLCNYYYWLFGKGTFSPVSRTVAANNTTLKPLRNPITMTYGQSGLYPVTLTLVFVYSENSSATTTYMTSVEQTIAVSSESQPYALFLYAGIVPNPSVINVAENAAGGPFSFDPQVDYEPLGAEVNSNIYSTLLIYNGSSTTQFIPVAATKVPSVANGGISQDYTTYTFQIRTGLKFSNGDPLTAYDVWYSMVRDMLFVGGNTGTGGWILAQYLIPGATSYVPIMTAANDTTDFNAIMSALTYSNSSNSVTFRLANPTASQLFLAAIQVESWIFDATWLNEIGAGITFTSAGFYAYQNQGNSGNFNLKAQWDPVASGPYMIQSYVAGQSVTLTANPGFPGVPGIPMVNNTVVIEWVKDPETAYNLFTSGQADIVTWLPTDYLALIPKQVANGKAGMYEIPSLSEFFFVFNVDINETTMKTDFGPQYHVPSDYLANLDVREAFAYAFNYTNYINEIIGNQEYGINFGSNYAGAIIPGLPYYVPPSQLQNVPTYDLVKAKQLLQQSGQYDTSINIPIGIVDGDTASFTAAQMWAAALNSIDPNIVMNPVYNSLSWYSALPAPPIFQSWWFADYPYPSDFVDSMYKPGRYWVAANAAQYLNSTGHADQAAMFAQMNSLIQIADSTTNATLAAQDYRQAEQLAINLYIYVYLYVPNTFWVVKPYMNGYQGQVSYDENPMTGPGPGGLYFWWVKTCGSVQACSGRNIGP
jgi:peptide/nickel transport system substrate-binding protein